MAVMGKSVERIDAEGKSNRKNALPGRYQPP